MSSKAAVSTIFKVVSMTRLRVENQSTSSEGVHPKRYTTEALFNLAIPVFCLSGIVEMKLQKCWMLFGLKTDDIEMISWYVQIPQIIIYG